MRKKCFGCPQNSHKLWKESEGSRVFCNDTCQQTYYEMIAVNNKKRERDVGDSSLIVINVGGQLFTTLKSTLTSQESILSILEASEEEGRIPFARDADGYPFIDTDPEQFKYILHFLRVGKLHPDIVKHAIDNVSTYSVTHPSYHVADYLSLQLYKDHYDGFRHVKEFEKFNMNAFARIHNSEITFLKNFENRNRQFVFGDLTMFFAFFNQLKTVLQYWEDYGGIFRLHGVSLQREEASSWYNLRDMTIDDAEFDIVNGDSDNLLSFTESQKAEFKKRPVYMAIKQVSVEI